MLQDKHRHVILQVIRGVFRTLSNIKDGAFCEKSQRLLAVNYFRKKLHLKSLAGF